MNFPTTKRTRIYKKPGVYLTGLILRVAWRCAAVAELAIAPSEFLTSVLVIDFPCRCGAAPVGVERRTISHGRRPPFDGALGPPQ
jgi:hypothetical protein